MMIRKVVLVLSFILAFSCFTSCLSTSVEIGKKTDLVAFELPVTKAQDYHLYIYGVQNGDVLDVTNIYWFDNWGNGWTEARFVASGVLQLKQKNKKETFYSVEQPLVLEYPEIAKIRYKDTYLTENNAITALNNRMLRIESLNEVIAENHQDLEYSDFDDTYRNFLFPEKFKKSPQREELNYDSKRAFGDGTFWNVEYTEKVFPEYMWEARNSGTLFRDWEEGFDLLYVMYTWENMFGIGQEGTLLYKKTKAPSKQ